MSKKGKGKTEEKAPVIVVKRVIKKNTHHGGAWKLAYADFATAMMALFLILWLLGQLTQNQKDNVSEYFKKPLREVFIRNNPNDSNIPRYFEEPTLKSEPAPIAMDLNNKLIERNKSAEDNPETSVETHTSNPSSDREKDGVTSASEEADKKKASEHKDLEALKQNLLDSLRSRPDLREYEQYLNIKVINDGLKIDLRSLEGQPMFSRGKKDFANYAKNIIQWLSQELANNSKKISIVGHTDSQPYIKQNSYSNWELSADRANAVRRYLIGYGVKRNKIIRVQGASDRNLLHKLNPYSARNRRIEIILLTDEAAEQLLTQ